jgi:tetratricopeptide (TPR) repeat protein
MSGGRIDSGALDNHLRVELLFGQAFVVSDGIDIGAWARMQNFRALVPGRRSPRDVGDDANRYRGVRLAVTDLRIEVDASRLRRALSGLSRTLDGIAEIDVAFLEDHVRLAVRLESNGAGENLVVVRFGVLPDVEGQGEIRLRPFEYLVLGNPAKPAPLVIADVLDAIIGSDEMGGPLPNLAPRRDRDMLVISAARLAIAAAFAPAGWKLPGTEHLRWSNVLVAPGRASLSARASGAEAFEGPDSTNSAASRMALAGLEASARAASAEDALFRGDLTTAAAAYRENLGRHGTHPFVLQRLLHVLCADGSPAAEAEASALIRQAEAAGNVPVGILAIKLALTRDVATTLQVAELVATRLREEGLVEDEVDTLLTVARTLMVESPANASPWVDRALRAAPRSASALQLRVRLARALGETERYEDGLTRLLALATSRTVRARLHRELARVRREAGDFDSARVHLLEGLELTPESPSLHLELGRASAGAGRSVEAVQSLRRAAASELGDAELSATALTESAQVWLDGMEDVNSALYDVRRAIALLPNRVSSHRVHLKIARSGDEEEELRAVETAISRLDPNDAAHRAVLADAYQRGIELDESRGAAASANRRRKQVVESGLESTLASGETIETSTQPRPARSVTPAPSVVGDRDSIRGELSRVRRANDNARLAELLPRAADLEPDPAERAALLGELGQLLYYELEDSARASQYLEEAQRLDPEGAGSDYGLLSALEAVYEDTASAEGLLSVYRRKLEQAGSDEIRNVYRLLMAGVLFEQLSRPSESLSQLERVLQSDPRNVPALRLRAKVWEITGRRADAADALESMTRMAEVDPFERQEVIRDLGRLEWHVLGRLDKASRRFEELLLEIPGDTDCLSSLKQIYARAEKWEQFVDVLRRELCILSGSSTAFPTIADATVVSVAVVANALHSTFARILAEAAEVEFKQLGEATLARRLVDAATRFGPSDVLVHELLIELARAQHDDAAIQRSILVIAGELLDERERDELVREGQRAAIRQGRGRAFLEECNRAGIVARSETSPKSKRAEDSRLERLDAIAADGQHSDAIAAIDAWLPSARHPTVRRNLLLRKGRWLLDRGADAKSAVLPLKGALILDSGAADTRLELLRASCRLSDVSQATDQLREYLEARGTNPSVPESEVRSLQRALDDLTSLPRGPGEGWVHELVRTSAPPVFEALQALGSS